MRGLVGFQHRQIVRCLIRLGLAKLTTAIVILAGAMSAKSGELLDRFLSALRKFEQDHHLELTSRKLRWQLHPTIIVLARKELDPRYQETTTNGEFAILGYPVEPIFGARPNEIRVVLAAIA